MSAFDSASFDIGAFGTGDVVVVPPALRLRYTTPPQYIAKFGLAEATQLLADEENLLTPLLLLDAIAGTWTGSPSLAEQVAGTAALARLVRQIDVSSNFMDGYLRAAYCLPFPDDTPNAGVLEECCQALVRCSLADDSDNATERMDEAGKTWRSWLKDVQAGRVTLTAPTGEAVPARRRIRTGKLSSGYDWGSFGSVR